MELERTARALRRVMAARRRIEAARARTDTRDWAVARRERTRHLIELGGLVGKAGLVELTDDDRATMLGALMEVAGRLRGSGEGIAEGEAHHLRAGELPPGLCRQMRDCVRAAAASAPAITWNTPASKRSTSPALTASALWNTVAEKL